MSCPHCQESARFVSYRDKSVLSLVGEIEVSRAYYHCRDCAQGHFPWDETLRLTSQRLTPGAQEVAALAGVQESFGKAADRTLYKLAGLRMSESTVQRTTEAAGERVGKLLDEGKVFGEKQQWPWHQDANGRSCAYVSLDATGIMMQGENGSKVEGRMPYVGMVFNPQPRSTKEAGLSKPCDGARYVAGLYSLEDLGPIMRRQAAQVGMASAEQWIALSDGGNGLEHFFEVNFPQAVTIVDFWHAVQYLTVLGKRLSGEESEKELLGRWCHKLKHEGGESLLQELESLDLGRMTEETRSEHEKVLTYYRNQRHRMNYPEYLKQGWQIASGAVESACKMVINQRLSQGGMRWGECGSDAVAHLRALYRSNPDQWEAFWAMSA